MANDNIFSGLKVVDLASFIAGPGAAVILSDFGADVIKVEPPAGDIWRHGHKLPPQPQSDDPYQWHLANRNKRGLALDLKSPERGAGSRTAGQMGRRPDRQYAASRAQATQARVRRCGAMEPAPDLCGSHRLWREGAGRGASGLRHHLLLGAQRPAVDDARRRRAADLAGRRQRRQRDRRRHLFGDRHGALSPRAHRQGSVCHDVAARRGRLVGERLDPGRAVRGEVLRPARSASIPRMRR